MRGRWRQDVNRLARRPGLRTTIVMGLLAAITALASCAAPTPSPSGGSPAASPQPGRPYAAATVLGAMRDSRRPGGVAQELQTDEIAGAVAEQLWTWDGTPWRELAIGGACGPETCTLEVTGSADGSAGTDAYAFSVDPATGEVRLTSADLEAYPAGLVRALEAIARDGVPPALLEGLALAGARWLPPPDDGRYWISYRSGGEEGSPGLDVLVDLSEGAVIDTRQPG